MTQATLAEVHLVAEPLKLVDPQLVREYLEQVLGLPAHVEAHIPVKMGFRSHISDGRTIFRYVPAESDTARSSVHAKSLGRESCSSSKQKSRYPISLSSRS